MGGGIATFLRDDCTVSEYIVDEFFIGIMFQCDGQMYIVVNVYIPPATSDHASV